MLHRLLVLGAIATSALGAALASGCSSDSSPAGTADASADSHADVSAPDAANDAGADATPDTSNDTTTGPTVTCSDLCDSLVAFCLAGDLQYDSKASCVSACTGTPIGTYGDMADSVGCRLYYANHARSGPTPACEIAGPFGGGTCGDRCTEYCRVLAATCTGANQVYATTAACMAECGSSYKFDPDAGFEYTTSGNTLNCREGALLPLLSDPTNAATVCPQLKATSTRCH
jgi:hypothetical protein